MAPGGPAVFGPVAVRVQAAIAISMQPVTVLVMFSQATVVRAAAPVARGHRRRRQYEQRQPGSDGTS